MLYCRMRKDQLISLVNVALPAYVSTYNYKCVFKYQWCGYQYPVVNPKTKTSLPPPTLTSPSTSGVFKMKPYSQTESPLSNYYIGGNTCKRPLCIEWLKGCLTSALPKVH